MRTLLAALTDDPSLRRRRRLRAAAIAGTVTALVAASTWFSADAIAHGRRQRYWSSLTNQLLEIERERGLLQLAADALRARDANLMSVYRSYRPKDGVVDHEDPTVAAALLREVKGSMRDSEAWISAANEILGRPISYAVLEDHRATITALVFAPDGRSLYSGAEDGEVRRWRFGERHAELIYEHGGQITALVLTPDGRTLLSSGKDQKVRRWSTDSPGPSKVIAAHEGEVTTVVVDHQGLRALSGGKDKLARIIGLEGDAPSRVLAGHRGTVFAGAFSP
ncbi:MAG: hypothetical protein KC457_32940, partial [Myxococcales bacterium]|nr:hypothetical protein [Myxococcales bacterium]